MLRSHRPRRGATVPRALAPWALLIWSWAFGLGCCALGLLATEPTSYRPTGLRLHWRSRTQSRSQHGAWHHGTRALPHSTVCPHVPRVFCIYDLHVLRIPRRMLHNFLLLQLLRAIRVRFSCRGAELQGLTVEREKNKTKHAGRAIVSER